MCGVREQLSFLWGAAEAALLEQQPPKVQTARYFAEELVRVATANGVPLSEKFRASLCERCHAPKVPGLTTRVRLRGRTKRSPASLRTVKKRRRAQLVSFAVRSHLVETCLLCGAIKRHVASHAPKRAPPPVLPDYIPLARVSSSSSSSALPAASTRSSRPLGTTTTTAKRSTVEKSGSRPPRLPLDPKPRKRPRQKK